MEQRHQRGYLQRLADIDAAIAQAQPDRRIALDRAAGFLAGRVGCRVSEAHVYLLRLAAVRERDPDEVAAEVLQALEGHVSVSPALRGLDAMLEQASLSGHRAAVRDRRPLRGIAPPGTHTRARLVTVVRNGRPGDPDV